MTEQLSTLHILATRVRQMILMHSQMVNEQLQLQEQLKQRDARIADLEKQLEQCQQLYADLKTARMLQVSDPDVEGAKKRLAHLIREVDRCITMLSE